ncbi:DUF3862 domain-containing protein [Lysinibacillus sp. Ag94]|uniref:DUF3862 domain-containing protein n=1 Tax=Lysinibacillus sp. Ag94 TaxID=2936682 RepID=UPI00200FD4C1|nr:DUF3862 domain-containing protein [Lysinibacillus sp. Ag94]UPW82057.1 DUF3862 domain-containing protein [Lysinibacillus sp. Ag94]
MKKKLIFSAALVLSLGLAGCSNDSTKDEKSKVDSTKQETTAPAAKEETSSGKLTEEKFKQIKEGMTYEEVFNIVGSKGKVISEIGTDGDSNHTVIYEFETDGSFSTANMTFQGNKLINKTQIGMGSSDVKITIDQFNKLENGMTEAQVFEILGGEGDLISESGNFKIYTYNGEKTLSSISITLQDGKLLNKTQMGLE